MHRTVPFKAEHVELMDLRDHEKAFITGNDRIAFLAANSIAVTGVVDGVVVLAGGVVPYMNGNADIWLLPSVYLKDHQLTVVRELRKWLFQVREDLQLIRMESTCPDDELHTRWMESLGFECEGVKRKYFMGNDYRMWGRVWE
jgi:hypothetical protein